MTDAEKDALDIQADLRSLAYYEGDVLARAALKLIEALTAKVKLMDDLDAINGEKIEALEAKLAKAVAFLEEIAITGDWFTSDMNDLIKELKGESHE